MMNTKYEYQSDFAKHYFGRGKAEGEAKGEAKGRVELLLKLLVRRFGPLPAAAEDRVRATSPATLDVLAERLLGAASLDEVLAPECARAPGDHHRTGDNLGK